MGVFATGSVHANQHEQQKITASVCKIKKNQKNQNRRRRKNIPNFPLTTMGVMCTLDPPLGCRKCLQSQK